MLRRSIPFAFVLLLLNGCALYSDVTVGPLTLLPSNIERGSDLQSMLNKADFVRAAELASLEPKGKPNANDLAAAGKALLACGRFPAARTMLRSALDLDPFRTTYADIAWDLAQVEYLENNFASSLEWANIAMEHGLQIRPWHLKLLESLQHEPVYRFSGAGSDALHFRFGHPDVPRVNVQVNGRPNVEAIIDSGAVLSIMSQRLAESLPVRSLGTMEGTFFGLLGEPIQVRFGIVDRLQLGEIVVDNVPVAIMPDDKMRFLVNREEKKEFRMDFLLGSNLLKEFRLELDFDRERAIFTRLTPADRRPAADQNLFFQGFRPHVRGAINRRGWFLFVFDTGSEITFLNEARISGLPVQIWGAGGHSATLQGLGGAMKHGSKLTDVQIGIDRWAGDFRTLPMYGGEEKDISVGIIGQNLLKNFNVVLDFGRMRVDLKRR
jgi:tetratricopeptide (TPR) repeat protein